MLVCFEEILYTAIDNKIVRTIVCWLTHLKPLVVPDLGPGFCFQLLLSSPVENPAQKTREDDSSLCIILGQGYPSTKLPCTSRVINPLNHSSSHFPRTQACYQDGWIRTGSGIHCQTDCIKQGQNRKYMVLSNWKILRS